MSNTVTIEINPLNISKILLNHSLSFTDLKTKQTIDIDSPSVFNDLYNKYGSLLMNVSLEEASRNNYPITNNNPNNLNITYGDTYVEGPKSLTASLLVKDYLDPEIDSRYYASNSDDAKSIDDIIKDYRDYYGCSLLEACQLFAAKANWNYHKDMFYRYNWKDGKSIKTTYGDKLWEQMQQDLRQIADVDSEYLGLAADPQNAIKTSMKLYDDAVKKSLKTGKDEGLPEYYLVINKKVPAKYGDLFKYTPAVIDTYGTSQDELDLASVAENQSTFGLLSDPRKVIAVKDLDYHDPADNDLNNGLFALLSLGAGVSNMGARSVGNTVYNLGQKGTEYFLRYTAPSTYIRPLATNLFRASPGAANIAGLWGDNLMFSTLSGLALDNFVRNPNFENGAYAALGVLPYGGMALKRPLGAGYNYIRNFNWRNPNSLLSRNIRTLYANTIYPYSYSFVDTPIIKSGLLGFYSTLKGKEIPLEKLPHSYMNRQKAFTYYLGVGDDLENVTMTTAFNPHTLRSNTGKYIKIGDRLFDYNFTPEEEAIFLNNAWFRHDSNRFLLSDEVIGNHGIMEGRIWFNPAENNAPYITISDVWDLHPFDQFLPKWLKPYRDMFEVSKLLPKGAKPFTLKHDIPLNNFRAFDWYDNEIKLNTLNDFRNVHKFEPKIVTSSNLLEYLNNVSKVDYYPTVEELLQLSDLLNTNSSILKNVNFTYEHLPLQIRKILGDVVSRDGVNTGWVFNSKNKTFYKLNPTDMSDVLIKMLMPDALGTIIDYKLNPERLKATLLGMGWDDNALNEYVLELYTLLNPRKVHLEIGNSFENPNIPMGKASGRIVGNSPEWDIMLNRAISGDPLMLFELYLHEIGGHLATGSVASNRQKLILLFPRTYEVIQHNNLLLKNTLLPNDFANKVRMPIYLLVQDLQKRGLTDDEIEDLIPIMQADQKRLEYRISEQEGLARVHAANMSDLKFPGTVSLNENLLRHYFSPESIDKLKKAILSVAIPISVGYGVNQNIKNN